MKRETLPGDSLEFDSAFTPFSPCPPFKKNLNSSVPQIPAPLPHIPHTPDTPPNHLHSGACLVSLLSALVFASSALPWILIPDTLFIQRVWRNHTTNFSLSASPRFDGNHRCTFSNSYSQIAIVISLASRSSPTIFSIQSRKTIYLSIYLRGTLSIKFSRVPSENSLFI